MMVSASANAQEFSVAVVTQTNLQSSSQHNQPVHIYNIEMGADVQPLEEGTSSVPIMGNEPITNIPFNEENNESEITDGNQTINGPLL